MTKAEQKLNERIHILKVMLRDDDGGGLHAASIADAADDHITRRGIGQKLASMAVDGLVQGQQPAPRRRPSPNRWGETHYAPDPMLWFVTPTGRWLGEQA